MGQCLALFPGLNQKNSKDKYKVEQHESIQQNASTAAKKPRLTLADIQWAGKRHESGLVKNPGSIDGQAEFIIEDCEGSELWLLDRTVQVTVDQCRDCFVFIGPSEGSVFIRNCTDCFVVVSSQQLRLRDCQRVHLMLYTTTSPSIETSSDIHVSPIQTSFYPEFVDQLISSQLGVWNNRWWDIYDFNAKQPPNYKISLTEDATRQKQSPKSIPAPVTHWADSQKRLPIVDGTKNIQSFEILSIVGLSEKEALDIWTGHFAHHSLLRSKCCIPTPPLLTRYPKLKPNDRKIKEWKELKKYNCISWVFPGGTLSTSKIDEALKSMDCVHIFLPQATTTDVNELLPQPKD